MAVSGLFATALYGPPPSVACLYECASRMGYNGELFMWGRNCHVIDGNQPASYKYWSPEQIYIGDERDHCALELFPLLPTPLKEKHVFLNKNGRKIEPRLLCLSNSSSVTQPANMLQIERSPGNKESDFRETGASFKEDRNYPQLIELIPKENSNEMHCTELLDPVNHAEVLMNSQSHPEPHSEPENAPFDGMDKTDLNRKNHSDGTTVQDASALSAKEKQGNSYSSIKLQEGDGRVVIPEGGRFRNKRVFNCLHSPLIPDGSSCLCSGDANFSSTLLKPSRRPISECRPHSAGSGQWISRKPWDCDSSSNMASSDGACLECSSVPGRLPNHIVSGRVRHEGQQPRPPCQSKVWMTRHLSPLTSHPSAPRPLSPLIVKLNPSERLASHPVYKQAIYSSGTAWKDISRSPDPVLSQKRPTAERGQQ
ncbi:uncharacterized protein LOC136755201 [Amia ocellicauda]|uniref:uncharacterized protein LOC136755201 n=1 Tax=Amia ocellicauda TaxID=2972642 RepID=UPI0034640D82